MKRPVPALRIATGQARVDVYESGLIVVRGRAVTVERAPRVARKRKAKRARRPS